MSLASALLKKIIEEKDLDTWSNLRKSYLPLEFQKIHTIVESHVDRYYELPTFEDLKYEVRDQSTLDKIGLIEREVVDTEPYLLLDYLKSEFTQSEAIQGLEKFLDESMTYSSAEETIESLYTVITNVEKKVDLVKPRDSIEKVELFDSDEELDASLRLGINEEYDEKFIFSNTSLILLGGYRGSGKSVVCNNIAQYQQDKGKSVIKFSVEMTLREELQRQCAIATGVSPTKLRYKELSVAEWDKVARWWAARYENGYDVYEQVYLKERDFHKFHSIVSKAPLAQPVIDIIHTPELTIPKFKAEVLKRLSRYENIGCIILDYLNKVSVSDSAYGNKFDWIEQIQVSDKLKTFAEEIGIPIVSPFQTKASGEVKFSKDILVPADAAFTLSTGEDWIEFENIKMRHMEEKGFISKMDWYSLKAGPETAIKIVEGEEEEPAQDI